MPADAALVAPSGCPFHLGTGHLETAAGTLFMVLPVVPSIPAESCRIDVTTTATIAGPGDFRQSNVMNNPLTSTFTVTFFPGQLPPEVSWPWGVHWPDLAGVGVGFTAVSAAGGSAQLSLGFTQTCVGITPASAILRPIVAPNPLSVSGIAQGADDGGYWTVDQTGNVSD
jgi:hypothetical protein